MNLNYSMINRDQVQVLEVSNLINEYANKEILKAVDLKIKEGFSSFVVDLSQVPFMNSVGLNFLIMLRALSADNGGRIAIANASRKVIQLLEMTKLQGMIPVSSSVEEALETMGDKE